MLGTGSVKLRWPQQTFVRPGRVRPPARPTAAVAGRPIEPVRPEATNVSDVRDGARAYRCPIAGCDKVFQGSRGGWDGHVGSLRLHPDWHPELQVAEERKRRFETEFPGFFR